MSAALIQDLIRQADALSPEERLRLAARLIERAADAEAPPPAWSSLSGMANPPLLGEDAQAWVSRTRAEADLDRVVGEAGAA